MRERVIHQTGLWAAISALAAALLLAVALAPQAGAQNPPAPPQWFYGFNDYDSLNGATVEALTADGTVIQGVTISGGEWGLEIFTTHVNTRLRITNGDDIRETALIQLEIGKPTRIRLSEFTPVAPDEPEAAETIEAQVRARLADDGRLEFGARRVGGEDVLPTGRFLPTSVVNGVITPEQRIMHGRWLLSSPIDLGDGYVIRVMARVAPDGRIEFGFYLDGVDAAKSQYDSGAAEPMFLPTGRYFPSTLERLGRNGRDVNRWLSSTTVDIPPAP